MVQRRERLKKQLLRTQLELIELKGAESLASANSSGDQVVVVDDQEELESIEEEEGPSSPPSVRQTR